MCLLRKIRVFCLCVLFAFGAASGLEAAILKVNPTMTRAQIQAVIDSANDNDTIRFAAGNYDFSATPFSVRPWSTSGGALVVTDKSLKFVADKGVILLGKDSILDGGIGTSGIIAFNINNSPAKDISFKGFTFDKFLFGIFSGVLVSYDPTSGAEVQAPSCRDFTVQNCVFLNIHRCAAILCGVQGNVKIIKNTVASSLRAGLWIDWSLVGGSGTGFQPHTGKITITNNTIRAQLLGAYIMRAYQMSIKNNSFDATGFNVANSEGILIDGGSVGASIVNNKFADVGYALDLNAWDGNGAFPFTGGKITNNKISALWGGIWSGGRDFHGNKFINNTINVTNKDGGGIFLYGNYEDTFINNKIRGVGDVAISLRGFDNTAAGGTTHFPHHNLLKKNSVKGFTVNEGSVDYYLGSVAHDNMAIGICSEGATYYDQGTNNIFTCIFPDSTAAASLKNGFTHFLRNPMDRKPLER